MASNDSVIVAGREITDEDLMNMPDYSFEDLCGMVDDVAEWRQNNCQCSGEPGGKECPVIVSRDEPYFSSPCGTHCHDCMSDHCRECEVCNHEFGLWSPGDEDEDNKSDSNEAETDDE